MIVFKATDEQAKQIAVNAIHASEPVGMGLLHYVPGDHWTTENIPLDDLGTTINLDYVQGRMVKLYMKKGESGTWAIKDLNGLPNVEYQSWAKKYPTYDDLILSVIGDKKA